MASEPRDRLHYFLQRWDLGEVIAENAGDRLEYATLATLLDAYDQMAAGRETWRSKALEMEADRDRLDSLATQLALDVSDQSKRARAAEAVVEQVQALVDTWRKMAGPPEERADDAATMLRRVIASLSDVLPEPAATAHRVMPPEIDLAAIPGMEDGDAATVTGTVSHRQVWPNAADADRAVVSLTDANTPAHVAYPIRVSPAGWEQYGGYLALGARVTCAIGASGENAWLTAAIPAGALDWTAEDESGWAGREADDFPRSAYVPEQQAQGGVR